MAIIFRQLYDHETSTYTYLLADADTREALLIDPVLEQVGACALAPRSCRPRARWRQSDVCNPFIPSVCRWPVTYSWWRSWA